LTVLLAAGGLAVASLPYWLPELIVRLRMRVFARINGDDGIPVPGDLVSLARFAEVYAHPAANGRSRGAALSDLFWYWLSPGPEIHQEHLEPGERYDEVASTTRRLLATRSAAAEELAARCMAHVLAARYWKGATTVRLRDLMMPVWAEFYYELVFGQRCPPRARELIVANANDVVTALKCCGLRHMATRQRLTWFLVGKLRAGERPRALPAGLSTEECALYLQGTFFNTAVVQSSEAMAHLLMAIAQHRDVQDRLAAAPADGADGRFLDHVMDEALRMYPLFGIAHRITSADIVLDEQTAIPRGSVLCFSYPAYHHAGYADPDRFDPDRWSHLSPREAHHIPFGMPANRPCPAWHLAPVAMRAATREILARFELRTAARHTRAIPNRGPCLLIPRDDADQTPQGRARTPQVAALLVAMRLRDRWEDLWRSIVQLVLGSYMVWDARRRRLCERYFAARPEIATRSGARP
jgi:hypothetical protein